MMKRICRWRNKRICDETSWNYLTWLRKNEVRRLITEEKIRPDGRKIDEVRPLNAQVDLLPRVHGSALFTRGETQVLSVCTLGAMGEVQKSMV